MPPARRRRRPATSSSSRSTASGGRRCSPAPIATTSRRKRTASPARPRSASGAPTPDERRAVADAVHVEHDRDEGSDLRRPVEGQPRAPDQRPVVLVSGLQRDVRRAPPTRGSTATTRSRTRTSPCSSGSTAGPASRAASRRSARGTCCRSSSTSAAAASRSAAASRPCRRRRPIASARSTSSPTDLPRYWDYGPFDAPIVYAALERAAHRQAARALHHARRGRRVGARRPVRPVPRRDVPRRIASSSASGTRCSRCPSTPTRRRCW